MHRLSRTAQQPTGVGFQRGTHANRQLVHNDGTGAHDCAGVFVETDC